MIRKLTDKITQIVMEDQEIDLFEGQYPVKDGVTYNQYVIIDEKTALLDTVDKRRCDAWLTELEQVLGERMPDMLFISHMEPDHAGSIAAAARKYPQMELVGNAKTFVMLDQFLQEPLSNARRTVAEGDVIDLGSHSLHVVMAPMVHWPEVMVCYESATKTLFAADGFGRFGSADETEPWEDEARRYYINIVGKYGAQVTALLKKAAALPIERICPLHGPVLAGKAIERALELYTAWAGYVPQERGVLVAYAGFHGHTAQAAETMAKRLMELGERVTLCDLSRVHKSYAVADAFRYDRMVLAAATYDGAYAPMMEAFLSALKVKNYQKRTVALMENGTWAPMAAKQMRTVLEGMKNVTVLDEQVTIRSAMKQADEAAIRQLAEKLAAC